MRKSLEIFGLPFHELNEKGEVFSLDRSIKTKTGITRRFLGKQVPSYVGNSGYRTISIRYLNRLFRFNIHRIVAIVFIHNPNNLSQVNHVDGNKLNNSLENLEWCTAIGNIRHYYKTANIKRGESNKSSKLNKQKVLEILRLVDSKEISYVEIGARYGVTQTTVSDIVKGKSWHKRKFSIQELEQLSLEYNILEVSVLLKLLKDTYGDLNDNILKAI